MRRSWRLHRDARDGARGFRRLHPDHKARLPQPLFDPLQADGIHPDQLDVQPSGLVRQCAQAAGGQPFEGIADGSDQRSEVAWIGLSGRVPRLRQLSPHLQRRVGDRHGVGEGAAEGRFQLQAQAVLLVAHQRPLAEQHQRIDRQCGTQHPGRRPQPRAQP
ncbi:MAG: hypothetical protein DCF27_12325 [Lysobacteraceae bacterium]|nr:MAG: hypothetical protein DCF27_12325 [Xanthomonadaceae bacterium]